MVGHFKLWIPSEKQDWKQFQILHSLCKVKLWPSFSSQHSVKFYKQMDLKSFGGIDCLQNDWYLLLILILCSWTSWEFGFFTSFKSMNWKKTGMSEELMDYHIFETGFMEDSYSVNWPSYTSKEALSFSSMLKPYVFIKFAICKLGMIYHLKFFWVSRYVKVFFQFVVGCFDYVGCSHQWWHIIIFSAIVWFHDSALKLMEFQINGDCPLD